MTRQYYHLDGGSLLCLSLEENCILYIILLDTMAKLAFVWLGRLLLLSIRFSRLSRSYRLFLLSQTTENPEKVVSLKELKAQIFLQRCLHQTSSLVYFSLIWKPFQPLDYSYLLKFHSRSLDRTSSFKGAAENAHHHHPHRRVPVLSVSG
jgi:hypothetical protein